MSCSSEDLLLTSQQATRPNAESSHSPTSLKPQKIRYGRNDKFSATISPKVCLCHSLTLTDNPGTDITDHFRVVERPDSQTVLLRGGTSPLVEPDGPRDNDALFEFEAKADFESGFAEFRIKSVCFSGTDESGKPPFEEMSPPAVLHRLYTKMLLENAVSHCKEGLTANIDWDMVTGRVLLQDKSVLEEKLKGKKS